MHLKNTSESYVCRIVETRRNRVMLLLSKDSTPKHDEAFKIVQESLASGIKIADTEEMKEKFAKEAAKLANGIMIEFGISNVNSSTQVKEYFSKSLSKEDLDMCKKNGNLSFDRTSLEYLSARGIRAAQLIRQCRVLQKKVTTLSKLDGFKDKESLVHPESSIGKTNRLNYANPPLMSINKDMVWDVVLPREEDSTLYSIDIIQQEPTILVNMLNIQELKVIMVEVEDFYTAIFKLVFGRICTEEERAEVKTAWNAMSYGAAEKTIIKYSSLIDGGELYRYFDAIPEYKNYKRECKRLAKNKIQKQITYFGKEVYAEESGKRLERVLLDIPIQGTGADILAMLVEKFDHDVNRYGIQDELRLYFTRHDEVVVECSNTLKHRMDMEKLLRDIFEFRVEGWTPFRIKVKELNAS